jgi:cell division protein FtsW (lipid II flippase)
MVPILGDVMSTPVPLPERRPRASLLRLLLLAPFVGVLWISSYNSLAPKLGGIPFFYWYQLLWVVIAAVLIAIVYFVER